MLEKAYEKYQKNTGHLGGSHIVYMYMCMYQYSSFLPYIVYTYTLAYTCKPPYWHQVTFRYAIVYIWKIYVIHNTNSKPSYVLNLTHDYSSFITTATLVTTAFLVTMIMIVLSYLCSS